MSALAKKIGWVFAVMFVVFATGCVQTEEPGEPKSLQLTSEELQPQEEPEHRVSRQSLKADEVIVSEDGKSDAFGGWCRYYFFTENDCSHGGGTWRPVYHCSYLWGCSIHHYACFGSC